MSETGRLGQTLRRSTGVVTGPRVTVNPPVELSDRARSGHGLAVTLGFVQACRTLASSPADTVAVAAVAALRCCTGDLTLSVNWSKLMAPKTVGGLTFVGESESSKLAGTR
jgi:hypothetical protein